MAIKKVGIVLIIDTGEKEDASFVARVDKHPKGFVMPGADETYLVQVNDAYEPGPEGKPNKQAMLTSAAHELGHVLSGVFKVKGGMHEDPRYHGEVSHNSHLRNVTPEQGEKIYQNEAQAWEYARKIWPELNEIQAEEQLESYEKVRAA